MAAFADRAEDRVAADAEAGTDRRSGVGAAIRRFADEQAETVEVFEPFLGEQAG